jgi:hypothetical protein
MSGTLAPQPCCAVGDVDVMCRHGEWPAVLKAVESTSRMWAMSFWADVERRPQQVEAAERSYRKALPRIYRERLVGQRGRNQPTTEQDGRASV